MQNQPGNGKGRGFFEVLFEHLFGWMWTRTDATSEQVEPLADEDIAREIGADPDSPNGNNSPRRR